MRLLKRWPGCFGSTRLRAVDGPGSKPQPWDTTAYTPSSITTVLFLFQETYANGGKWHMGRGFGRCAGQLRTAFFLVGLRFGWAILSLCLDRNCSVRDLFDPCLRSRRPPTQAKAFPSKPWTNVQGSLLEPNPRLVKLKLCQNQVILPSLSSFESPNQRNTHSPPSLHSPNQRTYPPNPTKESSLPFKQNTPNQRNKQHTINTIKRNKHSPPFPPLLFIFPKTSKAKHTNNRALATSRIRV